LYDNDLVDSDGHAVRFKSEAVDDRIVDWADINF